MRTLMIAGFLIGAVSAPALAADEGNTWIVKDSVENCSLLPHKPGEETGLTIMGDKAGYGSPEGADKAMREADCAGIVE
ncbi:hypothetical protein [Methyloligella solikamskensis]|uniref:Uncharacterized protein n=1 Tax=Methyloligella solikamskensis TaxID=1177756 RepID=A0ABW3J809_9HYPH